MAGGGRRAGAGRKLKYRTPEERRAAKAASESRRRAARRKADAVANRGGAVETLKRIYLYWMGRAATLQQLDADRAPGRPAEHDKAIERALARAESAAKAAAPFQSARLASVDIGGKSDAPIEAVVRVEITEEEARY